MSATLQQIKHVAGLKLKKHREETGQLLVEGRHPIEEAWRAELRLLHYFVLQDTPFASLPMNVVGLESHGASTESASETLGLPKLPAPIEVKSDVMARMASTDSPPPCLAVFEKPPARKTLQGTFALVLDGVQDPGNLGTLIRSAIAFGVDSVVLTGDCVEPFSPKVIRASAGLVFALPIIEADRTAFDHLFTPDWKLYATTGHGGQDDVRSYRDADYTGACAIILGNEGRGVSENLFSNREMSYLTIPMDPRVESLNVGVSGSIILAEAAMRRRGG